MEKSYGAIRDQELVQHLRDQMNLNLKSFAYLDAIFYADKVLHLLHHQGTNGGQTIEEGIRAVYELAYCYFLNKEYLRCV